VAKPAKRLKAVAQTAVPQTRDDTAEDIRKIGDLQRQFERTVTAMNDGIAEITSNFQPGLEVLKMEITTLQEGVQSWCEGHRNELTNDGKVKTANLITGEVCWRQRPPSVRVNGAESVIEALNRLGLGRFVRTKEEINKEAILNEPAEVKGVAGIIVITGVEDFVILPFEQEAA
jgi:phage host-nuclease inhibitor protein Gam